MSLLAQYQAKLRADENLLAGEDPLRLELGWKDVASGLTKMLIGYFLLFACIALAVGLVMYLVVALTGDTPELGSNSAIILLWIAYGGNAFIGLGVLVSYCYILAGKFRCMIHAPERCGARWLIFGCMLGLVCGPILGIALNMAAVSSMADNPNQYMKKMAEKSATMRVDVTDLLGPAVSLTTTIMFVLFLRSIGSCFNHTLLVSFVDMYLTFTAVLIGISLFLMFNLDLLQTMPLAAAVPGFGWMAALIGYVFLMMYARIVILTGLKKMKSPLAAD